MRLLWARHSPRVDAVVRRLVPDPDQAADVAQEVWIQVFRALPSWRGDAQFGTWIHRVAVNRTLNAIRGAKRRERVEVSLDGATAGGGRELTEAEGTVARAVAAASAVAPEAERALLAAAIDAAAQRLAPGARQVFVLHDVEGWTHEEIAERLGITSGGSKSQLFKARARLRQMLAPLVEGRGGGGGGGGAERAPPAAAPPPGTAPPPQQPASPYHPHRTPSSGTPAPFHAASSRASRS